MPTDEDLLVGQYVPVVRRLALQLIARLPASVELDGLMQAGLMGLLDAARRYEHTAEAQFETYAITRVRGAMLDELRSQDWLPRSVRKKARSIEQAIHQLGHRLMRPATEVEIAEQMDMPLADYQALLDEARGIQVVHYEDLARGDTPSADALGRALAASEPRHERGDPLSHLLSGDLRRALANAIRNLPDRERLLLSLHFEQDLNQKEISVVMGITEGRVSQLRSQAVVRIRAALARDAWHEAGAEVDLQTLL